VSAFIDEHRARFGVEPICRTVGVSASTYYHRATGQRSACEVDDERLLKRIEAVHAGSSAGSSPPTCAPISSSTPCGWRSRVAKPAPTSS
jgi:hypothetical protein